MKNLRQFMKSEIEDYKVLLRNTPPLVMILFVISVIAMNLLANKELVNIGFLALDCGFLLSWLSFLCMDMLTKRFGAKPAIKLSLFAIAMNLCMCVIFYIVSLVPGNWGEFYTVGDQVANDVLNRTIGGSWYILFGSMLAFAVASVTNALLNVTIGKLLKFDNFVSYALRSYVSTALGQFVDNFIFALVVSKVLFGWTMLQCVTCSLVGAIAELVSEVVFSPFGFTVCRRWESEKVGDSYLNYCKERDSK